MLFAGAGFRLQMNSINDAVKYNLASDLRVTLSEKNTRPNSLYDEYVKGLPEAPINNLLKGHPIVESYSYVTVPLDQLIGMNHLLANVSHIR
jgi:hypothetical protein